MKRTGKGTGKGKGRSQKDWKSKHKILNGVRKRFLLGSPKERKAIKASQQAVVAFRRVVFALSSQMKTKVRITPRTLAEERTKKEKARKELVLNPWL